MNKLELRSLASYDAELSEDELRMVMGGMTYTQYARARELLQDASDAAEAVEQTARDAIDWTR